MKLVDHRELPGKAYVQFIITESGEVKEVNVRTHNKYLKEEALRIFADLKIERPARKNSENVAIKHVIPISFNTKNFKSYEDFFEKNGKIPSQ
ncbi:energy transducer TonB [Autumnicola edwardsiae]|uniref:Energy transducer TonB n=1 Tax=Autumnicola edwardsiae TaxID=3075594 RepID=A0ABU3CYZ7_9FLAO|nr:energy transducer TonB [Zunongwangia sp. F297]MDT0651585.1 energy transducer TonB [Zunongwangia sp. F297]